MKRPKIPPSAQLERALLRDNVARAIAAELGVAPHEQLELTIASPSTPDRSGHAPCGDGRRRSHSRRRPPMP